MNNKESDIFKEAAQPKALKDVFDWIQEIQKILDEHLKSKKWYQKIGQSDKKGATKLLKILNKTDWENNESKFESKDPLESLDGLIDLKDLLNTMHEEAKKSRPKSILRGPYFQNVLKKIDKLINDYLRTWRNWCIRTYPEAQSNECSRMLTAMEGTGHLDALKFENQINEIREKTAKTDILETLKNHMTRVAASLNKLDSVEGWLQKTANSIKEVFKTQNVGDQIKKDEKDGLCKLLPLLEKWVKPEVGRTLENEDALAKRMMGGGLEVLLGQIQIVMSRAPEKSIITHDWFIDVVDSVKKFIRTKTKENEDKMKNWLNNNNVPAKTTDRIETVINKVVTNSTATPATIDQTIKKLKEKIGKIVKVEGNDNEFNEI